MSPRAPAGRSASAGRASRAPSSRGPPPRSSWGSGGPRPSSPPPLPTVAPSRGRSGYGRAVSGYALIIFFRLAPCPPRPSSGLHRLGHGHILELQGLKCLRPLRYFRPCRSKILFSFVSQNEPPDGPTPRKAPSGEAAAAALFMWAGAHKKRVGNKGI